MERKTRREIENFKKVNRYIWVNTTTTTITTYIEKSKHDDSEKKKKMKKKKVAIIKSIRNKGVKSQNERKNS